LKERVGYETSGPIIAQHISKRKLGDSQRSKEQPECFPRDVKVSGIEELQRGGEISEKKKAKVLLPPLLS
jgi:hypothetical protein